MSGLTNIARFLVGVLFIFSGLVKANDSIEFAYKLVEYFKVFGIHFLIPVSSPLAILISILEMMAGFMILIGARVKLTLWLLLLMILFFSFLTFYAANYNKFIISGCFGYAIPLTSWESFAKDFILLVLIIILFIGKDNIHSIFGPTFENTLLLFSFIAALALPLYTYNYLPVYDFRPFAIGKNIPSQTKGIPDELKHKYRVKDKKSGEEKIVDKLAADYDLYYDFIESVTEITKKGVDPKIKDFYISTLNGVDHTAKIIENPGHIFLLICYDLQSTNKAAFGKINDLAILCKQDQVKFIALTASTKDIIKQFKKEVNTDVDFYTSDETVLKMMIRSNPGLMLLKDGTVQDKWHHHSFPSYTDVKQKHFIKKP